MNKLCTDGLLKLVAAPFVELLKRYGSDIGSQGGSLISMFHAACGAELLDMLQVEASPKLIQRSLVVASSDEVSVPSGRILDSIKIEMNDRDPQLLLRSLDDSEFKFTDYSIWFACTASKDIELNKRNLQMLKKEAVLGDLMGQDRRLRHWPRKNIKRNDVLAFALEPFEYGKDYSEKEVNEIINGFFDDHALLRRELVVSGLMKRSPDGRRYWRAEQ